MPCSYGGAARICQCRVPKRGSEATERGRGGGGVVSLSYGTESFEYSCMKTAFSCTLHVDTIVRGNLCTGIDQFPTLSFLILFLRLMNLSFSISFSFSFFFPPPLRFCQPIVGGGGGACAPRSYATGYAYACSLPLIAPPISGLTKYLTHPPPPFAGFLQAFPALEIPLNRKHCSTYPL